VLSAKGLRDIRISQLKNLPIQSPDVGFLLLSAKGLRNIRSSSLGFGVVSLLLYWCSMMIRDCLPSALLILASRIGCFLFCGFICTAYSYSKWLPFNINVLFNQLLVKTAELSRRSDLLPSGFCCSIRASLC
jgi:hypothetical protein